jgi:hypothetical protein
MEERSGDMVVQGGKEPKIDVALGSSPAMMEPVDFSVCEDIGQQPGAVVRIGVLQQQLDCNAKEQGLTL